MTTTLYTLKKGDEVATTKGCRIRRKVDGYKYNEPLYVGTVVSTDGEWTMVLTYDGKSKRYRTANLVLQKDYEPFPFSE